MNKTFKSAIFWFRRDLRLKDNPALDYALANSESIMIAYLHCPSDENPWEIGAASKWWLHHSLKEIESKLKALGTRLIIRMGESSSFELNKLVLETQADLVTWNRLYDPQIIKRDKEIKASLIEKNIEVKTYNGYLLKEPWEIRTTTGGPYQVFTPFWRNLQREFSLSNTNNSAIENNNIFSRSLAGIKSLTVDDLNLLPTIKWDATFYKTWEPGEDAAQKKLAFFLNNKVKDYKIKRDYPEAEGSSSLSPHLHFGELSPAYIWNQCNKLEVNKDHAEPFLRQLGWRDFAHHLLYHFPETPTKPLKKDFNKFPWAKDKKLLKKWQQGQTGFPVVDAGMRELWATGTMHNRVRMIVGSILVKNFLIHWSEGASWFWDCLVDADLANNTLGWQWIAGCGADAAPYFRIFNPVSQSERFDAAGNYIRKWVPELSLLPDNWIHKPWEAPEKVLVEAQITLGKTYPKPAVDLKASREEALEAYYSLKGK